MNVRRPAASGILIAVALLVALGALVAAAVSGGAATPTRQQLTHQIASQVHCPVCADLSAADSPAPLARQMRQQIDDQVAAGVPAERILQGFVDSYGPSVLMSPPNDGWGRAIRVLPFVVVALAVLAATMLLRRALRSRPDSSTHEETSALPSADRRRVELALAELRREEP
ncbi:MAG TPA: cytochrome c-type biogenesis protein CcmH [Jiangellaceae bacterium]|nr:cytochrome c-type biogenesis protein CcmH [Jiangellaceae bacterium]